MEGMKSLLRGTLKRTVSYFRPPFQRQQWKATDPIPTRSDALKSKGQLQPRAQSRKTARRIFARGSRQGLNLSDRKRNTLTASVHVSVHVPVCALRHNRRVCSGADPLLKDLHPAKMLKQQPPASLEPSHLISERQNESKRAESGPNVEIQLLCLSHSNPRLPVLFNR